MDCRKVGVTNGSTVDILPFPPLMVAVENCRIRFSSSPSAVQLNESRWHVSQRTHQAINLANGASRPTWTIAQLEFLLYIKCFNQ